MKTLDEINKVLGSYDLQWKKDHMKYWADQGQQWYSSHAKKSPRKENPRSEWVHHRILQDC